jgi:protein involved in sex pheromone biosynthesis
MYPFVTDKLREYFTKVLKVQIQIMLVGVRLEG